MWLWLLVIDCQISFNYKLKHQSLILSWTSKLGWSSKVCCTNWYSQKCCVTNICTKTEWPCYICIQINAIQLHCMIFPYVYGWDDLLKSTKEVSLVKPLNQIKPLHQIDCRSTRRPGHLVASDGWSTRRQSKIQLVNSSPNVKCRRIEIGWFVILEINVGCPGFDVTCDSF